MAVEAADVPAADAGEDGVDLAAGGDLRLLQGLLDGLHRRVDVDDDALAQPVGTGRSRHR